MALRLPIRAAVRSFNSPYSQLDENLKAIANAPGLYDWPLGDVSKMGVTFCLNNYLGPLDPSIPPRRFTRLIVKTKTNEYRGRWVLSSSIRDPDNPSGETIPVNAKSIDSFCYDPTYPLFPPNGYFEYEYSLNWPSNVPPSSVLFITLRGTSGTMPVTQFVEFQIWDDVSPDPTSPGGGGDPPIDPNTEIPMQLLETQSYANLGGSGVRTIPNNGNSSGALSGNGLLGLQFDMVSTFQSFNGNPLDSYSNPYTLLQNYTGSNTIFAWRTNDQTGGIDFSGGYVQWTFRGYVRKITQVRINYYKTNFPVHPVYRFLGSQNGTDWTKISDDFSLTDGSVNTANSMTFDLYEMEARFKHLRLLCVSGSTPLYTSLTQYIFNIEFEISGVSWEKGDRKSVLSAVSNIAKYSVGNQGGYPENMFDNLFNDAFDGTSWWYWVTSGNGPGAYIIITFPTPIKLRSLLWFSGASDREAFNQGEWALQGSNNRYNWHDLTTFSRTGALGVRQQSFVIPGELSAYRYYRLICTGGGAWDTQQQEANYEWQFDIEGVYESANPVEPLVQETMSYLNLGGSGARADGQAGSYSNIANVVGWTLDVSTTFTYNTTTRHPTRLIEGVRNTSSAGYAFGWPAQDVTGKELKFSMRGRPRVIDEFTWYQNAVGSHGMFRFQGSDDGSTWDTLSEDFELGTATAQVVSFENTKAYYHYRLLGVSGTTNATPWLQEIEFRISGLPLERGDRRMDMKATTDIVKYASDTSSSYTFENLINGLYGDQNISPPGYGWRPAINQDMTGKHMTFEFPYKVRVIGIYLLQSYDRTEARPAGTWAVQIGDDGENWENVGTIELTVAGAQGWHDGPEAKGKPAKFLRLYGIEGSTDTSARFWREFEFEFALPEGDPFEAEFKDDGEFYAELSDVNWDNLALNFTDDSEFEAELDVDAEPFDVNFRDKTNLLAELVVISINPDHPIVQVIPNHSN